MHQRLRLFCSASAVVVALAGLDALAAPTGGATLPAPTVRDLVTGLAPSLALARGIRVDEASVVLAGRHRLGAPLTESNATAVLTAAGLDVAVSDPARPLSRSRLDVLMSQAIATLASQVPGRPGGTSIDDCLALSNHGQCVECCKEAGGSASICAKTCHAINKPSASEPLP